MNWVIEWDKKLFLWLNGFHADWLDLPVSIVSERLVWVPFYVAIITWLVWKQKRDALWSIVFIAAGIVLSDQITSTLMKPFFERLRPCHDPSISHLLHLVNGCGAKFGFASSHAANTFSLATFLVLLHPGRNWVPYLMFTWATVVSYSRIYLGVHYPGDILVGALIGSAISYLLYLVGSKGKLLKHI